MNVAIYGRRKSAWTLTEQAIGDRDRSASGVTIGRSTMRWDGDRLVVDVDERTAPWGRRVRGTVCLRPEVVTELEHTIHPVGDHRWWPIAPLARIDVDLSEPGVRFSGHGYHDANVGDLPLDASFDTWCWSRARDRDLAMLSYDVRYTSGEERSLAFSLGGDGTVRSLETTVKRPVRSTLWRLGRHVRADAGVKPRVVRPLEDGPFYARSLVTTRIEGRSVTAMHETLAAQRLRRDWVRRATAYRMRTIP